MYKENLKCKLCGEIINAGTYGVIFNSKNNVNQVIKGSIKGHSITTGCPKDYEHEINMYSIIYKIFKSLNLKNINIIDIQNKWVENRRCYYEMDRIYPFQINEELKIKIIKEIDKNKKYENPLIKFIENRDIFMLKPGLINRDHFSQGNVKNFR